MKWASKAANKLDPSIGLLCEMFVKGHGVPQNYIEAHKWCNIAGAYGIKYARDFRDDITKHMTPEQIFEAQGLAREWMKKHNK